MWLKKYINHLKAEKNKAIKQQAEYPKKSYLYQLADLGIAMREFWITVCESFVRRGVVKIFVLVVIAQLIGLVWRLIRGAG